MRRLRVHDDGLEARFGLVDAEAYVAHPVGDSSPDGSPGSAGGVAAVELVLLFLIFGIPAEGGAPGVQQEAVGLIQEELVPGTIVLLMSASVE